MKKILTAIAAAVFVIYPCVCFSSYEMGVGIQKDLGKEIEEIEDLPDEQEAMAKQTASLTAEKGSVRRRHSRISLIGLMGGKNML